MATTASYTFTVPYIKGTDNLVTQSNLLLNQILGKILEENSNLSILHTYVYGSEEFEGYPIWNTPVSSTPINNDAYTRPTFVSDIILLGKSNSNYCMVIFITKNGTNLELKMGLACGTDTDTIMQDFYTSKNTTSSLYAPSTFFIRSRTGSTNKFFMYIRIPYNNSKYVLYLDTYTGTYSKGYHFKSDSWNWIAYGYSMTITSDELIVLQCSGTNLYAGSEKYPMVINLNEEVCRDPLRLVIQPGDKATLEDGCKVNLDNWGYPNLNSSYASYSGMVYPAHMLLGNWIINGQSNSPSASTNVEVSSIATGINIIPFLSSFQLPKLKIGQVFIRKMFIPNSAIKTDNIVLLYTPLDAVTNNMLFSVNGHTYLSRMPSQLSIAVRVD